MGISRKSERRQASLRKSVTTASMPQASALDKFKIWLRESRDVLPDDFELPV